MQFSLALFAILPALVAAVGKGTAAKTKLPISNSLCASTTPVNCPASTDQKSRCLIIDGGAACATLCPVGSTCPNDCKAQHSSNGFCTNGQVLT
ncbi:hypothetical protein PoMZ_08718, partial [Pyricularia oryzae]